MKIFHTIRNNWKKSVFFSGLAAYGVYFLKGKYEDSLVREEFCRKAEKYGEAPIKTGERARRITVFLNPAARKGKGKDLFDKNVAPLFHLAGIEVTLVKTEYEGQAKRYMEVLDQPDSIVVAGGDGTLLEVLTGLLRRDDQEKMSKVPIGVIPLGLTNALAGKLFAKGESEVRWMGNCAMAIIEGLYTRPIDVMKIVGNEGKDVYAVSELEWSALRDAYNKKSKYWYFGGLKHRWVYLRSILQEWPPILRATFDFTEACDGCSKCYHPPQPPPWRWWHIFMPPAQAKPEKDYSHIQNPDCGVENNKQLATMELRLKANQQPPLEKEHSITVSVGKETLSKKEFITEGWQREKGNGPSTDVEKLEVQHLKLMPDIPEGKEAWFTIDSEQYEAMPIDVTLLKKKLRIFHIPQENHPS